MYKIVLELGTMLAISLNIFVCSKVQASGLDSSCSIIMDVLFHTDKDYEIMHNDGDSI